jgi:hypothetical protein
MEVNYPMSLHCPACKKPVKAKGMPDHSSVTYAEVGIKCLVIWEDDFNRDRESAEELVRDFLG